MVLDIVEPFSLIPPQFTTLCRFVTDHILLNSDSPPSPHPIKITTPAGCSCYLPIAEPTCPLVYTHVIHMWYNCLLKHIFTFCWRLCKDQSLRLYFKVGLGASLSVVEEVLQPPSDLLLGVRGAGVKCAHCAQGPTGPK